MEAPHDGLPDEFERPISEYVKDFLAEMCEDRLLDDLWERNRESLPTNAIATHNLLRILCQKRSGDLTSVDWSGMDLRRVNLFPFRRDMRLELSTDPRLFEGTILGVRCFMPRGHSAPVTSVCFNPKGSLMASGSLDNTIRMWDTATGRQVGDPLRGHGGGVLSVCFSSDGTILASGSGDRAVHLWNPTTGQQVGEPLRGHSSGVESVCFNKDGNIIASCSGDGNVRLWNPASASSSAR
jgi:WD40 repeat protein